MKNRLTQIRLSYNALKCQGLFVTNQYNVSYLTGFSGLSPHEREGFFFITNKNAYLLTFPTYYGLYRQGGEGFSTICITPQKKMSVILNEIIIKEKIISLAVEKDNLTLGEYKSLRKKVKIRFRMSENLVENLRLIKNNVEISLIKQAALVTDSAFSFIKNKLILGVTEKDIALELEFFLKKNASDIAFDPIVAFGKNAAIPHYLSSDQVILTNQNLILLDFGAKIQGYCSDMTRVVFPNTPSSRLGIIYETVLQAQELGLGKIQKDVSLSEPDKVARKLIENKGFMPYLHSFGHGVGREIHENPRLKKGNKGIFLENMVVTAEPGIYIEGEGGIRIEDLVLLKDNGIEILSKSPKSLKESILKY